MNYTQDVQQFKATHPYKRLRVGQATFNYLLCGAGRHTLVLLVGGMGVSEMWLHYIEALEADYQILTFDYPLEYETNAALCAGIRALMDRLGIGKGVMVGSSYGGYLAQIFARRYPEKTEALALFSTAGLCENTLAGLRARYKHIGLLLGVMRVVPYGWLKPIYKKVGMKHIVNATEAEYRYLKELFDDVFRDYTKEMDLHMTRLLADIVSETPLRGEEFAYLDGKVLLILPEGDDTFTPGMQRELVESMPHPHVVEQADGGHVATILHVAQYTDAIRAFMAALDRDRQL